MNLIEKIKGKRSKEKDMKEIDKVIDTLAYKYSIPQGIIRNIVWTWMQYEHKRLYNI